MLPTLKFVTNPDKSQNPKDTVQTLKLLNENVFATGGWDGTLRCYQINESLVPILKFEAILYDPIMSIEWLSDNFIAAACSDGIVRGVNLQPQKVYKLFEVEDAILGLHVRIVDGQHVAIITGMNENIYIFSMENGRKIRHIEFEQKIIAVDVGNEVAVFGLTDKMITVSSIRDLLSGKAVRYSEINSHSQICGIALCPTEKELAISFRDASVKCLEIAPSSIPSLPFTLRPRQTLPSPSPLPSSTPSSLPIMPFPSLLCYISSLTQSLLLLVSSSVPSLSTYVHPSLCPYSLNALRITAADSKGTTTAVAWGYAWEEGVWGGWEQEPRVAVVTNDEGKSN